MSRADGNATLSRFIQDRLTGTEEVYCCGTPTDRSAFWPHRASFCPECGEIWKREVYTYHFSYQPIPHDKWRVEEDLCPTCTETIFQQLLKEHS